MKTIVDGQMGYVEVDGCHGFSLAYEDKKGSRRLKDSTGLSSKNSRQ